MTRQDLHTLFNSRPYLYSKGVMYNLADHHYLTNCTFTRPRQITSADDQWFITFHNYRDLESFIPINCPVVRSHERWCRVDGVHRKQFTKFIEQYYPELFI